MAEGRTLRDDTKRCLKPLLSLQKQFKVETEALPERLFSTRISGMLCEGKRALVEYLKGGTPEDALEMIPNSRTKILQKR